MQTTKVVYKKLQNTSTGKIQGSLVLVLSFLLN